MLPIAEFADGTKLPESGAIQRACAAAGAKSIQERQGEGAEPLARILGPRVEFELVTSLLAPRAHDDFGTRDVYVPRLDAPGHRRGARPEGPR